MNESQLKTSNEMISFLPYFKIESILFLIDNNVFSRILLFSSLFFYLEEKEKERDINRENIKDESVILFSSKMRKKKKIVSQLTSVSVLFTSIV